MPKQGAWRDLALDGKIPIQVTGHRPAAALLHWQSWLGGVERRDLRLLVDRQHRRALGRIDIEANDILDLGGNFGSFDSVKVRTRCGLRPCAAKIRCALR
jgi:hypothetical protein